MYTILAYIYPSFVNTKLFWKIVKKQYSSSDKYNCYLCKRSFLFREYWIQDASPFQTLAKQFLNKVIYKDVESSIRKRGLYLFYADSHAKNEEVRLSFINWCINKYSK